MSLHKPKALVSAIIAATVICHCAAARAHHDGGAQLPVSLNVPGSIGGISNPGGLTQTRFGISSRAFRVSGHPLYSAFMGGDATVLMNALNGSVGVTHQLAVEAILPLITDLPQGDNSSHTGLGDAQLGLRWFAPNTNAESPYLWSMAIETSVPTGNAAYGFGADAFVSRISTRLSRDFFNNRMRLFADAGTAWAWAERRGSLADVALASVWQATNLLGVFIEARVLTAIESGRLEPINVGGRSRSAGDTSVVLTPALSLAISDHFSAAAGPQIPFGLKDFDFGFAVSLTYRQ